MNYLPAPLIACVHDGLTMPLKPFQRSHPMCVVQYPSAKEVEDLLTEVEDFSFQEDKREDKPKKDRKKVSSIS